MDYVLSSIMLSIIKKSILRREYGLDVYKLMLFITLKTSIIKITSSLKL